MKKLVELLNKFKIQILGAIIIILLILNYSLFILAKHYTSAPFKNVPVPLLT